MIWTLIWRLLATLADARRDVDRLKRELGTYSNDEIDRLLR